jgi:hypothetical protein
VIWCGFKPLRAALIALFLPLGGALAQENSPYSSFGIGDLQPKQFAWSRAMGGISAGLFDPNILNFANPASYAYLNKASLDVGLYGNVVTLSDPAGEQASTTTGNGSLSHMAFGFPVWKQRLGLSLGLMPFSRVQYNIRQELIRDPNIGLEILDFQGTGTLYEAYGGMGFRAGNFSVGANTGFVFGTINNARFITFADTLVDGAYSTRALRANRFRGLVLDAGLGYRFELRNELNLDVGATARLNNRINGRENIDYITLILGGGIQQLKDSVVSVDNGQADIRLPLELSAGFVFRQGYRQIDLPQWRAGADFETVRWSEFEGFQSDEPFTDSWRVRAGGEFTPADRPDNNSRPWDYRLGFQYSEGKLLVNSSQLTEFGISFGLGIPMSYQYAPQRSSRFNVSLEVGQRSIAGLFTETFYRGSLSFSLNDSFWFIKSRIN